MSELLPFELRLSKMILFTIEFIIEISWISSINCISTWSAWTANTYNILLLHCTFYFFSFFRLITCTFKTWTQQDESWMININMAWMSRKKPNSLYQVNCKVHQWKWWPRTALRSLTWNDHHNWYVNKKCMTLTCDLHAVQTLICWTLSLPILHKSISLQCLLFPVTLTGYEAHSQMHDLDLWPWFYSHNAEFD